MTLEDLVSAYRHPSKRGEQRDDTLDLARMMQDTVREVGSQQQAARLSGISSSVFNHYISILSLPDELQQAVDDKRLVFKAARSIADLVGVRDDLCDLAQPFIDKRISSTCAEKFIALAKRYPAHGVEEILRRMDEPIPFVEVEVFEPEPVPEPEPQWDAGELEQKALDMAGELDALSMRFIPEYQRLKLMTSLRILDARLKQALKGAVA